MELSWSRQLSLLQKTTEQHVWMSSKTGLVGNNIAKEFRPKVVKMHNRSIRQFDSLWFHQPNPSLMGQCCHLARELFPGQKAVKETVIKIKLSSQFQKLVIRQNIYKLEMSFRDIHETWGQFNLRLHSGWKIFKMSHLKFHKIMIKILILARKFKR